MNWTDITTFLTWLAGIGAPAVVAILLSLLAENWPAWSNFPHAVKFIVPMIVSVGLALLANVLLGYPALLAQIAPWFQMVVSAILAYIASQKTYQGTLKAQYGSRFSQASKWLGRHALRYELK
jgi:hypothetical protein